MRRNCAMSDENDASRQFPLWQPLLPGIRAVLNNAGINYLMVVHGEQRLKLYQPLPAADIIAQGRVSGCFDKGPARAPLS